MEQFDFNSFNTLMKSANPGLKLALVENMLKDVAYVTYLYNNPLNGNVNEVLSAVRTLRSDWKLRSAARAAEYAKKIVAPQADGSIDNDEVRNADKPNLSSTSTPDMIARIIAKKELGQQLTEWEKKQINAKVA